MNPWRTPQRVVAADCPDQIADVGRDRGPADTTARLATPIQTEPAPMPAHQRLGLEDNRGFAHRRKQPIEPDEDQAICCAQPEPCWRRPLQDDKLLAEKCCFGLPSRMRSEQSDEQSAEQLQEVTHPKARITHRGSCASPDTIFGSHRSTRESWSRQRRVIAKAEWTAGAANPRFVVTSLSAEDAEPQRLYEAIHCARGDMENRIKECQLDLFADRTSAATLRANQLRLWFAAMAYVL